MFVAQRTDIDENLNYLIMVNVLLAFCLSDEVYEILSRNAVYFNRSVLEQRAARVFSVGDNYAGDEHSRFLLSSCT